jgi:AraC-like DNA-binding protein
MLFFSTFLTIQAIATLSYSLFNFGGSVFLYAILLNNTAPFYFTLGPLLYLFVRGLVNDKQTFRKIDLLHFIPFLLHLFATLPYLLTPFEYKLDIARSLMQHYDNYKAYNFMLFYPHSINNIARAVQYPIYIIASLALVIKVYPKIKLKAGVLFEQYKYVYRFLLRLLIILLLLATSNLLLSVIFEVTPNIATILNTSLIMIYCILSIYLTIPIYLLFNPNILYGMPKFIEPEPVLPEPILIVEKRNNKRISEPKQITDINVDSVEFRLSKDIMQYLEVEKPYLKIDFSIHDICNYFNTPQHHIQYCFSHILNRNFRDIKNELRVKYAIELLNSNMANNISMEGIGRQAGFASNSNFYTSFKVVSGVTPNQWLLNIKDEELLCYKS